MGVEEDGIDDVCYTGVPDNITDDGTNTDMKNL